MTDRRLAVVGGMIGGAVALSVFLYLAFRSPGSPTTVEEPGDLCVVPQPGNAILD